MSENLDAVIVGSGPNGLAAAVALAMNGHRVHVLEAQSTFGGGTRSAELVSPGYVNDLCSAVHPLGISSPFFSSLGLEEHGLEWLNPDIAYAHPLPDNDNGGAVACFRDLSRTVSTLGTDGGSYRKLFEPFAQKWEELLDDVLRPISFPRHPLLMARFGLLATRSLEGLARAHFSTPAARALVAGVGAHSMLPLSRSPSAAVTMMLGTAAHTRGWPIPRGGSQRIADALVARLRKLGGSLQPDSPVASLADLPPSRVVLFDLTPRQLLKICGDRLSPAYRSQLEDFRYGPGVFKIDWALSAPVPWKNPLCAGAGTVHVGGTLEDIARAEQQAWDGTPPEQPFVLFSQPSVFDPTRAPPGKHAAWGYCHVPNGSTFNMTSRIEAQIERYAPGFGTTILARATANTAQLELRNANLVGGDIGGGVADLERLIFRPALRRSPYAVLMTNDPRGFFICSSSTPPGAGVHGMCGYHAATAARKFLNK
ncbi:MAG: NAD(P)/FAD-dependent oxidoreductase [Deltaproteobacteria bacterium]|nr:NAD(P)/FAD-dependent oxidoreductase [Deltaproteobacteria bacterium]